MLWTSIGIEPADLRRAGPQQPLATYCLRLPLVADGRIALVLLRANPEQARVARFLPDAETVCGSIRFQSGQWSFLWDSAPRPDPPLVRLAGNRFLQGDPVCLRQQGWPLMIYRVCPPETAGGQARAG